MGGPGPRLQLDRTRGGSKDASDHDVILSSLLNSRNYELYN